MDFAFLADSGGQDCKTILANVAQLASELAEPVGAPERAMIGAVEGMRVIWGQ